MGSDVSREIASNSVAAPTSPPTPTWVRRISAAARPSRCSPVAGGGRKPKLDEMGPGREEAPAGRDYARPERPDPKGGGAGSLRSARDEVAKV